MSSSDESSSDSDSSDLSFSDLGCGLSDIEFVSSTESDTLDEIIDFWQQLPLDLYSVPREGGDRWKRVVEKALKLANNNNLFTTIFIISLLQKKFFFNCLIAGPFTISLS